MDFETIRLLEPEKNLRVITLFRPERRNALSIRMRQELCACLEMVQQDDSASVVVLTGEGGAFSAGFDLREFQKPEIREDLAQTSWDYHWNLWHFPKPIIAAVNGAAMGAGFDMAAFCDLRLCCESAFFGHPEIKIGGLPLITPLRWIVGEGLARDLCYTGRTIDAAEALRIGLVSEIIPDGSLLERSLEMARIIAEAPVEDLRKTKAYMNHVSGMGFAEAFRIEHDAVFPPKKG